MGCHGAAPLDYVVAMLHVVMSTDSLSLPRPWFHKKPSAEPERFTQYDQTYPYLLEQQLRAALPEVDEVRVSNFATRASGLASAYANRMELFSWMESDLSVLHKGVVDAWPREAKGWASNTSVADFEKSYEKLLAERDRLNPEQAFIVIGICPTNTRSLATYSDINRVLAEYNAVLRNGRERGVHFIDMELVVTQEGEGILHPDGHHLSITGHKYLADRLSAIALSILGKQVSEAGS